MNTFIDLVNLVTGHRFLIFVVILAIGLVWIYFQIPKIKTKTAPPQGMVSSREDWVHAKNILNSCSIILSSIGLALSYGLYSGPPTNQDNTLLYFLYAMTTIIFMTVAILQIFNKRLTKKYLSTTRG